MIWPESSVPFLFGFNREIRSLEVRDILAKLIPEKTSLIIGAERADGEHGADGIYSYHHVFNSLFVLGEGAQIQSIYDKVHLVPFGEYMPFGKTLAKVGFRALSHRVDGFEAGTEPGARIDTAGGPPFSPMICYEIIFPGEVVDGRHRPDWLINVTNDAWFGDFDRASSAPSSSQIACRRGRLAGDEIRQYRHIGSHQFFWPHSSQTRIG